MKDEDVRQALEDLAGGLDALPTSHIIGALRFAARDMTRPPPEEFVDLLGGRQSPPSENPPSATKALRDSSYQGKEISASGMELIKNARGLFREGRHREAEDIAYECCRQEELGMFIGLLIGAFDQRAA